MVKSRRALLSLSLSVIAVWAIVLLFSRSGNDGAVKGEWSASDAVGPFAGWSGLLRGDDGSGSQDAASSDNLR